MAVIFTASKDSESSERSSRIIGPLVRWLYSGASDELVDSVVFCVRKAAHVTEFGILAVLSNWALRKSSKPLPSPWKWSLAFTAWFIATLYAATDEWHQSFVPNRTAQWQDVAIDSFGAGAGVVVAWFLGRWRRWW